jgi:hypothetical protein
MEICNESIVQCNFEQLLGYVMDVLSINILKSHLDNHWCMQAFSIIVNIFDANLYVRMRLKSL